MKQRTFNFILWAIAIFFVTIVLLQINRRKPSHIEIPRVSLNAYERDVEGKYFFPGGDRKPGFTEIPVCRLPGNQKIALPPDSVRVDSIISMITTATRITFPKNTLLQIDVPYATRYKFVLFDSSVAWLDGGSSLLVPLNFDTLRFIRLVGNGYFDVKENKNMRPLLIHTDSAMVAASTGNFEILADSTSPCKITNLSSRITIEANNKVIGVLDPFMYVEVGGEGKKWETVEIEPSYVPKLPNKRIDFHNKAVGVISAFAAMRYDVDVVISDDDVFVKPLTLHFDWSTSLESFVELITKVGGLNCSIENKKVIISSGQRM